MLTINQRIHGFIVDSSEPIEEVKGTLWRMHYEKNGLELCWLQREDNNKSFAIAFKTVPEDDTGVFHILEHSVLCGSEKYPVKEPFVDLLKGSLQTFLNALTYPDKTVYPLSSRNDKDFLNLIDVYMDAVLHPLILKSDSAFRQEGWHYEMDSPEGELTRNGVVYSEMKGAYASGESELYTELMRSLFPENCYGKESGGYPDAIPSLTYENYLASYHRYYHPSNARIFLDGSVALDDVLARLSSFLEEYAAQDPRSDIAYQKPVHPAEKVGVYEIGPEEDPTGKILMATGRMVADYNEITEIAAAAVLSDYLAGSNESPLKKAFLEGGYCEELSCELVTPAQQIPWTVVLRNVPREKADEVWPFLEKTLQKIAEEGLDKERMEALLNNAEFAAREKDYGGFPRGLVNALNAYETWLYGGNPADGIRTLWVYPELRKWLAGDKFEEFLRDKFLRNPHRADVRLLPSCTLGEERRARDAAELSCLRDSWSLSQREKVCADFRELREKQQAPDSPEARSSLPRLTLEDIPGNPGKTPRERKTAATRPVISHKIDTNGIQYISLYFDLSDFSGEELSPIQFLATLLPYLPTQNYSALGLEQEINCHLGMLGVHTTVIGAPENGATPWLVVEASVLDNKWKEAVRLIGEILTTDFYQPKLVGDILRQSRISLEERAIASGNSLGMLHAGAALCRRLALRERIAGIAYLRFLQEKDRNFVDEKADATASELCRLSSEIFTRERLTITLTGEEIPGLSLELEQLFPKGGEPGPEKEISLSDNRLEGFVIPGDAGFAVTVGRLPEDSGFAPGLAEVAAHALTYDYLWNKVRVLGGAYGTRLSLGREGIFSFSSYRDPNPAASLEAYRGAADALRELAENPENLTDFIISTIGEADPLRSPRAEGQEDTVLALAGVEDTVLEERYRRILATDPATLRRVADWIDKALENRATCVVGNRELLSSCGIEKAESIRVTEAE